MTRAGPIAVSAAVEGPTDETVLRRLVESAGLTLGPVYGRNGKKQVLRQLGGYNLAAQHTPWVVLVDLDHDAECAPEFVQRCLPTPAPQMRVAVREIEAWLLSDAHGIAAFLGVSVSRVPRQPDSLIDPKRTIIDLASGSRRRGVRQEIAPRAGSGRQVGPLYSSHISEFAVDHWDPAVAAESSPSLRRCIAALQRLAEGRSL
jgi:hypothetical protein